MRLYLTKREKQDLEAALDVHLYAIESENASQDQKEQSSLEIAKISGFLMSPLFPTGIIRNVLMATCLGLGIAGFFLPHWWLWLFFLVALMFSPKITGELSYLAGQVWRGYQEKVQE